MNDVHAPNRCEPRAMRISKVKFVVLEDHDVVAPSPPADFEEITLLAAVRNLMIRVIGRLEAARP